MKKILNILVIIVSCLLIGGCDLFKSSPNVIFNYNCEGLNDYKCQVVDNKLNCMFIMPECGEKVFVGWYDAKTSGKEINLDADFTKDTTIYAQWDLEKKETSEPTKPITTPDLTPTQTPAQAVEVKPEVIVKYKVSFNSNGGSGGQSESINVKKGDRMPAINKSIPIRSGYTFMGWFDNSNYKMGQAYYNELCEPASYYDRNSNLILYAGWKENQPEKVPTPTVEKYKITFNANGGSGGPNKVLEAIYNEEMPTIKKAKPTRKGYTFMGWFDNSNYTKGVEYYNNKQESSTRYNKKGNLTLYAGWKINKYTLTFNLNGGSGGQTGDVRAEYDSMVPTINKVIPIREGYTFTGWYDNQDYTKGKAYYNEKNEAARYFDKTSNLTLYAGWSKIIVVQKYKVTFNINGGTGTTPNQVEVIVGNNMPNITNSIPTRQGYTFMGWYNNATYSKGTQYYTNNNASARKYDVKNDMVLYAGWKINVLSIRYNGNGGTWNNTSSTKYTVDSSGTVILKSNNTVFAEKYNYGSNLASTGLSDYNGTLNWTRSNYYVPSGEEYIISNGSKSTGVSQSKVYKANDIAKYGGCDLSKKSCTVTVKVNWKKGQIIRAATYNIGYFGCGTSKKVRCSATVDQISEMFKTNKIDIIGIQEAVPRDQVNRVANNTGLTNNYTTIPANVNTILSKYAFKASSKQTTTLTSCHEKRSLDKVVVNINGVDISFYNTHYSYQSGCPDKQMAHVAQIISQDPNPVILTGDTNVSSIKYYEKHLKPIGFKIAAYDGITHGYCDSVFVIPKGHIDIVAAKTVEVYGKYSDHNFVYATLAIY